MRVRLTLSVLIQAALVQSITWTLHKSCYQNPRLRDGMITAVKDAVDQAKLAVEKLKEASYLPPLPGGPQPPEAARRIREVADFLTGSFWTKSADVIGRFERIAQLGGPVGANENFADGPTWQAQRTGPQRNLNYLNFVVACAPDLQEGTDRFMNTIYYDNLRQLQLRQTSSLIKIHLDIKNGAYLQPDNFVGATTQRDLNPEGDRLTVPESIVFHKLWLEGLLAKEGSILAEQTTLDYVTRQDSPQKHRLKGRTAMDTMMWRAEGTILHELFHLTAFGRLDDIPQGSPDAYGWANNVAAKNINNPELYALLGLGIKLTVSGYRVDQEGMIAKG